MKYMIVNMSSRNGIEDKIEDYSIFNSKELAYSYYRGRADAILNEHKEELEETVLEVDQTHIKYYNKDNKTTNLVQLFEINL